MPKRNLIWVLAILSVLVVLLVTLRNPSQPGARAISEFESVGDAYRLIKEHEYSAVPSMELREQAVRAMVSWLKDSNVDKYAEYIPAEKAKAIRDRVMEGKTRGLGLQVKVDQRQVVVVGSLIDARAYEQVLPGDVVVKVDGAAVDANSQESAEKSLSTGAAPVAELTVLRAGKERPARLPRREYDVQAVQGLLREGEEQWSYWIDANHDIGYLRLTEFLPKTSRDIHAAFRAMNEPNRVILDLRGNPGGGLQAAVDSAALFLPDGVTVVTEMNREGKPLALLKAHADRRYGEDTELVVLVDSNTASAAEIMAGALRLYKRAILVGERTRGKGWVQKLLPLRGDPGYIALTPAECLVGADQPIQGGIRPHVRADRGTDPAALRDLRYRACVIPPAQSSLPATAPAQLNEEVVREFLKLDPQLAKAVEVFRWPAKKRKETLEDAKPLSPTATAPHAATQP
jgi:carboxyl-terminal processing protease